MPAGYSSLGRYGLNAYDPRPLPGGDGRPVLTPGGSSSGSGIAVSANLAAVAVGTETSGSILSPGTANNVVGIKPTLGLVSRHGILPITADQDTAGPLARTVTDAAILLGVIAGFDPDDPATAACLDDHHGHRNDDDDDRDRCHRDYTKFLRKNALRGARIAVPRVPYWTGFSADQQQIMLDAIEDLRAQGAFVADPYEIPNQADISGFGICVSFPAPANCSTVLMFGQKHDLNRYLEGRPDAPVHTLADIIAFNEAHADVALKYGQAIFLAAEQLDTSPGSADTQRYLDDRALDLALTRTGLDAVFDGPDGMRGTRRRLRRDPVSAEPRGRGSGQGRLPEHRRARGLRSPGGSRRQPHALRGDVLGTPVQRAEVDRSRLRLRAGHEASAIARERTAVALGPGETTLEDSRPPRGRGGSTPGM